MSSLTSFQLPGTEIDLSKGTQGELNGLILGDLLGQGEFRRVFVCAINPRLVVKAETRVTGRFCNIDEWNLWAEVRDKPEIARWFAPIHFISASGSFLVMERTRPLKRMPPKVPNFMGDVKPANMGLLNGRPVFHDYANNLFETHAVRRFKLVDSP